MSQSPGMGLIGYVNGGNKVPMAIVPIGIGGCYFFYDRITPIFAKVDVDIPTLYSFAFNFFAIELGALVSVYTFLACRPTQSLQRIEKSRSFRDMLNAIAYTIGLTLFVAVFNFILAIFNVKPASDANFHSLLFLSWVWICIGLTGIYINIVSVVRVAVL
jgi:hypothetical protein